jgi:hypothetical protein
MRFPVPDDLNVPGRVRLDQPFPDGKVQCRPQGGAQVL